MTDTTTRRIESMEDALAAVANVAPLVRELAQQAEDERSLPDAVVDAFAAAGLWGVFAPRACGGPGLATLTNGYKIVRAMGYEDTTAGWALMINAGSAMIAGSRLPAEGRAEVFGDGAQPIAAAFPPAGQARRVDGGFVVSGKWGFASGLGHAGWVMPNTVVVDETGAPVPGATGPIDVRTVVVPRHEVAIIDDWYVAGLKGTGSVSFTMTDVTVPEHRTFSFQGRAAVDEPHYRLPVFSLVAGQFAGIMVGFAQRALDEVLHVLPTRKRPPALQPASEDPTAQLAVGRALAALRAVDAATRAIFGRYDARADAGEDLSDLSIPERAELHHHTVWVAETCREAVNELFRLGGASAIYAPGVLQRCWRDLNVLTQHLYMGSNFHELGAKVALGLPVDAPNL